MKAQGGIQHRSVSRSSRKVLAAAVLSLLFICAAILPSTVGSALAQEAETAQPIPRQDDPVADTDTEAGPGTAEVTPPAAWPQGATDSGETPPPAAQAVELSWSYWTPSRSRARSTPSCSPTSRTSPD